MTDSVSMLFDPREADDLRRRQLPQPTIKARLQDLDGAVLFGAGRFTRALIPAMRACGCKAAWIVDNNPTLWGSRLDGVEIRPAESLGTVGSRTVLIMSNALRDMAEGCRKAGVANWAWYTDISEVFGELSIAVTADEVLSQPEIERFAALLDHCPESLVVFKKALACRVTGDRRDFPPCSPGWYFPEDIVPTEFYRYFVDCGAFDGDTLKEWISLRGSRFKPHEFRYHAFEPEPANFAHLERFVHGLEADWRRGIVLHRVAVGDRPGELTMVPGGPGTNMYRGQVSGPTTPVVRLDDALSGEIVGAIKMDLEGYEPYALEGARRILQEQLPALLISIYHRPEHLWSIPLWIHDLGLGYRFFVRHHDITSSETVCYAVPVARLYGAASRSSRMDSRPAEEY